MGSNKFKLILMGIFILGFSVGGQARSVRKVSPGAGKLELLPVSKFKALSSSNQKKYIKQVQNLVYKFEKSFSGKNYAHRRQSLWLEFADAFTSKSHCLIGGVARERNPDKTCPTVWRTKGCDPNIDSAFRCGIVYGSVCVSTVGQSVNGISDLCKKNAKIPLPASYEKVKNTIDKIYATFCGSDALDSDKAICSDLKSQIAAIKSGATEVPAVASTSKSGSNCLIPISSSCSPKALNLGDTDFSASVNASTDLCRKDDGSNEFVLRDPATNNTRTFYRNEKGEVCQKVSADVKSKEGIKIDVSGILAVDDSQGCKTFNTCSAKIGGIISKQLNKIKNLNSVKGSKFCKFGSDGGRCPPKSVGKICTKALERWNSKKCPGGSNGKTRTEALAKAIRKIQVQEKGAGYAATSTLSAEDKAACGELFTRYSSNVNQCRTYTYGEWKKSVRKAYFERMGNSGINKFLPGETNSSLQILSRLANMGVNYGNECSEGLRKCATETQALEDLAENNQVDKEFCGRKASKAATVGLEGNTLKTNEIQSQDGNITGRISVDGDTLKIKSTDPDKGSVTVKFEEGSNSIFLHKSSKQSAPYYGKFEALNGSCPEVGAQCLPQSNALPFNVGENNFVADPALECVARQATFVEDRALRTPEVNQ